MLSVYIMRNNDDNAWWKRLRPCEVARLLELLLFTNGASKNRDRLQLFARSH